jgi:hypothetical protein
MKLIRLATIDLTPIPDDFTSLSMRIGDITIDILATGPTKENSFRLVVFAKQNLEFRLNVNELHEVEIPEENRVKAEKAIEYFANVISIREGSGRSLQSPMISIALECETDEERTLLSVATSIKSSSASLIGVKPKIGLSPAELADALKDRYDGVALLSEGLSHQHGSGQFHEFLRVFERAFRLGPTRLIDPLTEFLVGSGQGYSKDEVMNWLVNLRGPSTHADTRDEFFLESDIRPVVWRMQQAAYDVLMNKAAWRDPSSDRRDAWRPSAWTNDALSSSLESFEGADGFRAQIYWLDIFGVFPQDHQTEIRKILPESWWVVPPNMSDDQNQKGQDPG